MLKTFSNFLKPLIISIILYLFFFYPLLDSNTIIYSGKDSVRLHYLSRIYLYDNLQNQNFPFWTDRMFNGFPIFYDLERGYQNLDNVLLIYLLGPFDSYKVIHFVCYLLGSISIFLLIKKSYDFKRNEIYYFFTASSLIYFFSFFHLIHQQHFNFILGTYLLPFCLFCLTLLFENMKLRYGVILSFTLYFIFTLGSTQIFLTIVLFLLLYFFNFYSYKERDNLKLMIATTILSLILILPGIVSYYDLYSKSSRSDFSNFKQGSLDAPLLLSFFYPHPYGYSAYQGTNLSENYTKNESLLYLGIITILVFVLKFSNLTQKVKRFGLSLLILFLIMNFVNLPPFNLFRYWIRAEFIFSFYFALYLPQSLISKNSLTPNNYLKLIILLPVPLILLLNKNLLYILKNSITLDFYSIFLPYVLVLSLFFVFIIFSKKYSLVIIFLIIVESIYFFNISKGSLFMNKNDIYYQKISSVNQSFNFDSDYSLAYSSKNPSGYTQLIPKEGINSPTHYLSFVLILKLYLASISIYVLILLFVLKKYEIKL